MARLESVAKCGFFASPPQVVKIISSFIQVPENEPAERFLDPCCGDGTALSDIAIGLQYDNNIKTFGVELDKTRAEQAKQKLTKVICGDLNRIRAKKGSFSFMLLNPPYSGPDPGDDQRLEAKFLTMTTPYLRTDGVLVYLIPQSSLSKRVARFLASWYKDFIVCRFPGESYDKFNQIVVMAIKKPPKAPIDDEVLARLTDVPGTLLKELEERKEPVYTIPKNVIDNKSFYLRSLDINMEELQKEVDDYGVWHQVKRMMHPRIEDVKGKVLVPLRRGHMAVLVACGLCDGLIEKGKKRLLIKGVARKEQSVTIEHSGDMVTEKSVDRIKVGIRAIDLNTGKLINVE